MVARSVPPQPTIIALSERNKLYANSTLVCSDCSSFTADSVFLSYTSLRHHVRFMRLVAPLAAPDDAAALPTGPDEIRTIERGGRIVAVMPASISVVLQVRQPYVAARVLLNVWCMVCCVCSAVIACSWCVLLCL